jgi:ketosteroid isomerase-like protein
VKRCPTCNKTFTEEHLSFCLDDGTPLVTADSIDDEATVIGRARDDSPTGSSGVSGAAETRDAAPKPYQPPGSYVPPGHTGQAGKRRAWPWVLGCAVILLVAFATLVITARILFPGLRDQLANTNNNNSNANLNQQNNSNSNLNSFNSNSNLNSNSNSTDWNANMSTEEDTTPPPTNESEVLADLTDLEHEWTVANINADKKKLDRILADDYVGITDGKAQGKAEYLKTIKRDTAIQKWDFEDLKVNLRSDRATLTGIIRLDVKDEQGQVQSPAFRFTDKFVWRDGRWQATGSQVEPIKE